MFVASASFSILRIASLLEVLMLRKSKRNNSSSAAAAAAQQHHIPSTQMRNGRLINLRVASLLEVLLPGHAKWA